MSAKLDLTDLEIKLNLRQFLEIVWEKGDFLGQFLDEKLLEKEVLITDWKNIATATASVKYERTITSLHPLPLSLPWLPMFVNSSNTQTLEYDSKKGKLLIVEVSTIKGLPFVDPYIITEWDVTEKSKSSCDAHITLRFSYEKSSWLQGMVESNSQAELIKFFEMWHLFLTQRIDTLRDNNELDNSSGLHFLTDLLPESTLETDQLGNIKTHPPTESAPFALKSASPTISLTVPEDIQMSSPQKEVKISIPIQTAASTIDVSERMQYTEKNVSKDLRGVEVDNDMSPLNTGNILKICLSGLQRNGLAKLAAAIIVNLYAKIDVAAMHGIEVTNIVRYPFCCVIVSIYLIICWQSVNCSMMISRYPR